MKHCLTKHFQDAIRAEIPEEYPATCPRCPFVGKSRTQYAVHHGITHRELEKHIDRARKQPELLVKRRSKASWLLPSSKQSPLSFKCPLCPLSVSAAQRCDHLSVHFEEELSRGLPVSAPFRCGDCPFVARDCRGLIRHRGSFHNRAAKLLKERLGAGRLEEAQQFLPDKEDEKDELPLPETATPNCCRLCEKFPVFRNGNEFLRHLTDTHFLEDIARDVTLVKTLGEKEGAGGSSQQQQHLQYRCHICDQGRTDRTNLIIHVGIVHRETIRLYFEVMGITDQDYKTTGMFKEKGQAVMPAKPSTTSSLSKNLTELTSSGQAQRNLTQCNLCGSFFQGQDLLLHLAEVHFPTVTKELPKKMPFQCNICPEVLSTYIELLRHVGFYHKKFHQVKKEGSLASNIVTAAQPAIKQEPVGEDENSCSSSLAMTASIKEEAATDEETMPVASSPSVASFSAVAGTTVATPSETKKPIQCRLCPDLKVVGHLNSDLVKHLTSLHYIKQILPLVRAAPAPEDNESTTFFCPQCPYKQNTRRKVALHMGMKHKLAMTWYKEGVIPNSGLVSSSAVAVVSSTDDESARSSPQVERRVLSPVNSAEAASSNRFFQQQRSPPLPPPSYPSTGLADSALHLPPPQSLPGATVPRQEQLSPLYGGGGPFQEGGTPCASSPVPPTQHRQQDQYQQQFPNHQPPQASPLPQQADGGHQLQQQYTPHYQQQQQPALAVSTYHHQHPSYNQASPLSSPQHQMQVQHSPQPQLQQQPQPVSYMQSPAPPAPADHANYSSHHHQQQQQSLHSPYGQYHQQQQPYGGGGHQALGQSQQQLYYLEHQTPQSFPGHYSPSGSHPLTSPGGGIPVPASGAAAGAYTLPQSDGLLNDSTTSSNPEQIPKEEERTIEDNKNIVKKTAAPTEASTATENNKESSEESESCSKTELNEANNSGESNTTQAEVKEEVKEEAPAPDGDANTVPATDNECDGSSETNDVKKEVDGNVEVPSVLSAEESLPEAKTDDAKDELAAGGSQEIQGNDEAAQNSSLPENSVTTEDAASLSNPVTSEEFKSQPDDVKMEVSSQDNGDAPEPSLDDSILNDGSESHKQDDDESPRKNSQEGESGESGPHYTGKCWKCANIFVEFFKTFYFSPASEESGAEEVEARCKLCQETFTAHRYLYQHLSDVHFPEELDEDLPKSSPWKCPKCNYAGNDPRYKVN